MASTRLHETPAPKIPEHLSTSRPAKTPDEKIDRQMKDSFPASDPPSYSGGSHAIGAPVNRESESPTPDTPAVKDAEKKVKDGKTAPDKY
jgi:hypothetical protein